MIDRILVIVPSRSRAKRFQEHLDAFMETNTGAADLCLCVDYDDPERWLYPMGYESIARFIRLDDLRAGFAPRLSAVAHQWAGSYFAVASFGDDHLPRTPGWDRIMLDTLHEMRTGIVYGPDGFQDERLPTAPAMTSDIVRTLGWMTPPGLEHMFIDDFWLELGLAAGCIRYLPDVLIEHVHFATGKVPLDASYARSNNLTALEEDRIRWEAFCSAGLFDEAVSKVVALMEGP